MCALRTRINNFDLGTSAQTLLSLFYTFLRIFCFTIQGLEELITIRTKSCAVYAQVRKHIVHKQYPLLVRNGESDKQKKLPVFELQLVHA